MFVGMQLRVELLIIESPYGWHHMKHGQVALLPAFVLRSVHMCVAPMLCVVHPPGAAPRHPLQGQRDPTPQMQEGLAADGSQWHPSGTLPSATGNCWVHGFPPGLAGTEGRFSRELPVGLPGALVATCGFLLHSRPQSRLFMGSSIFICIYVK